MKKILIILANTNPQSFGWSLADNYEKGARQSGGEVRRMNLSELKFDPVLWKGYSVVQELEADLEKAQKDILWADHIVVFFPTWWASYPAILKGFFDRTILPGFGYKFQSPQSLHWRKLLTGKSARLIVTSDSPIWYNRFVLFSPGIRSIKKGVLEFCGIDPVKVTRIGSVKKMDEKERKEWIEKIVKIGERDKI